MLFRKSVYIVSDMVEVIIWLLMSITINKGNKVMKSIAYLMKNDYERGLNIFALSHMS